MLSMNFIRNYSLKPHNTFGVEVLSQYFIEVETIDHLKHAITKAKTEHLPILILGGGSNILFTKDFEGLTIRLNLKGIETQVQDDESVLVTAQAGENWHQFVLYTLEKGYGGLENLSLIPGNVGTSPIQNIGAYGVEIKDYLESCKVLNLETLEIETFDNTQCQFGYRDSIFKREGKGKYIILSVTFRLKQSHHKLKTDYGAIQSELEAQGITEPTIKDISNAVIAIRSSKLPNPKDIGNAGSFFKNPTISQDHFNELKNTHPEIPGYPNPQGIKVPAGWLIETAGWKGKQIGNVATHKKQALVIINANGQATGKEIYDFSAKIIESIAQQFGITLEREVNIL